MKEELDDKMNAARQEWGKLKAIEIEREIEKARENWQEELAKIVEQTELTAVEKAKTEWLKEQEKDNMSKEKEDVTQILTAAKTEWEREKVIIISFVIFLLTSLLFNLVICNTIDCCLAVQ